MVGLHLPHGLPPSSVWPCVLSQKYLLRLSSISFPVSDTQQAQDFLIAPSHQTTFTLFPNVRLIIAFVQNSAFLRIQLVSLTSLYSFYDCYCFRWCSGCQLVFTLTHFLPTSPFIFSVVLQHARFFRNICNVLFQKCLCSRQCLISVCKVKSGHNYLENIPNEATFLRTL